MPWGNWKPCSDLCRYESDSHFFFFFRRSPGRPNGIRTSGAATCLSDSDSEKCFQSWYAQYHMAKIEAGSTPRGQRNRFKAERLNSNWFHFSIRSLRTSVAFRFFGKQFEVSICVYKTKIIYQPQAIACGQRKQLIEENTQARIYVNWVQREKYHYNFMIAVKYAF